MNDFILVIIALAMIVELGRSAWHSIRVDEIECYHCDRVSEQQERELREEYKKAAIDQDVKNMTYAMYYLFGVHLHDEFGFGGKRLLRLFESVDKEIAT